MQPIVNAQFGKDYAQPQQLQILFLAPGNPSKLCQDSGPLNGACFRTDGNQLNLILTKT
jgi:hypothetical protein